MSAYPKFIQSTNTLQFQTYLSYPYKQPLNSRQRFVRSNGGGVIVQNLGEPTYRVFNLTWDLMPETDFVKIENWCKNVVNWMEKVFEFHDSLGNINNVRLMQTDLNNWELVRLNTYSGTLICEEVL